MDWFLRNLSANPPDFTLRAVIIFLSAALVLFIVGVIMMVWAGKNRKKIPFFSRGHSKLGGCCIAAAFYFGLWSILAYERIRFFGSAWWLILGFIGWLVWLGFIVWYFIRTAPKLNKMAESQREMAKYLPRSNQ